VENTKSTKNVVHPTKAYGWSPRTVQRYLILDFKRVFASTTNNPVVGCCVATLPP